ncbi:MAG: molybdopterin-dependent oxidoreductase [Myxococcota bacterium]
MADEILLPGAEQVKALFSLGGNPMAAWPDQDKTLAAMRALDLNVTLDIKMSATAKLADYVIAPKLSLEVPGMTLPTESLTPYAMGYPVPYAQYSPAIVDPPEGSDLIEEWEFFYRLASAWTCRSRSRRPGPGVPMQEVRRLTELGNMRSKPTTDALFEALTKGSRIPLAGEARYRGRIFEDPTARVRLPRPQCTAKLEVADSGFDDGGARGGRRRVLRSRPGLPVSADRRRLPTCTTPPVATSRAWSGSTAPGLHASARSRDARSRERGRRRDWSRYASILGIVEGGRGAPDGRRLDAPRIRGRADPDNDLRVLARSAAATQGA